MDQSDKKRRAAEAAIRYIEPGTALGVGTGSTVNHFIDLLPPLRRSLKALVASSEATAERLRAHGLTVSPLDQVGDLDLYVDGADEANPAFQLIKGGGGALTREKVLAASARRFVCIIDDSKWVGTLGAFPLPIEVLPMARSFVARKLVALGGQPEWRKDFVTDNGNQVLDIHNLKIDNPVELESRLNHIPGIVTVGLFALRPADEILLADDREVRQMPKPA
ncbi:MAG: ribose-5-phosphate isomerase RpiA [Chromatiales bacterium]|nr:ribose-5-phosphate isomerase RpiA [Chromatiales bacterium]